MPTSKIRRALWFRDWWKTRALTDRTRMLNGTRIIEQIASYAYRAGWDDALRCQKESSLGGDADRNIQESEREARGG